MEQDIYMDSIYTSTNEKVWPGFLETTLAWLSQSNGIREEWPLVYIFEGKHIEIKAQWHRVTCRALMFLPGDFSEISVRTHTRCELPTEIQHHSLLLLPPCPPAFSVISIGPPSSNFPETCQWSPKSSPCTFLNSKNSVGPLNCSPGFYCQFYSNGLQNNITCLCISHELHFCMASDLLDMLI